MPEFSAEFWVGTGIAIFTLLLGFGVPLAMDPKTRGEFRFAVGCFLLTAAITVYGIGAFDMSSTWPTKLRAPIAWVLFATAAVLTCEAIRWAHGRHLRAALDHALSTVQPRPSSPSGETQGTIDKAEPNTHQHSSTGAVKVNKAPANPKPASNLLSSPAVTVQAPYGNLALRCKSLGEQIVAFVQQRNGEKPSEIEIAADSVQYKQWYRVNDSMFRAWFYDDIKKLQRDLSGVNIADDRLDSLIKIHESFFESRNKQPQDKVMNEPFAFHLRIEDIEEIGNRFRLLATQVPH